MKSKSGLSASILRAIGLDTDHLSPIDGAIMASPEAGEAFRRLKSRADGAGIGLRIASGHRDYGRQLAIFNDKVMGARPVLSDDGESLCRDDFNDWDWLHAVLRFSALPGLSRHHWGTDFDVWDAAAVPDNYRPALLSAEYLPGGPFHRFSRWFSEREDCHESEGFFRPYETDTGGGLLQRRGISVFVDPRSKSLTSCFKRFPYCGLPAPCQESTARSRR
jgi:hypothetical protein